MRGTLMNMSPVRRLLWLWFVAFQAVHIGINVRGLAQMTSGRGIGFPAPPPEGSWTEQALAFLMAMALVDLANAALSVAAGTALLLGRASLRPLALIGVRVSIYAALVFDLATWWSGAWRGPSSWSYVAINALFVPVVTLLAIETLSGGSAETSAAPGAGL